MSRPTTVIVGASIGGVRAAQALRAEGYDGEVVLVGDETVLPYDKPPLSKAFLAGTATAADITLFDEGQAAAADVRLELGNAATGLDLAARKVELADGSRLSFDDLVVATGARARPSPWGARPGVHVVRTAADAAALREDLGRGGPLVIIGAGFIGAEIAATATALGVADVTLVDPVAVPLSRVLNPAVAERFGALHAERGVTTRFGAGVSGIDPGGVLLTDGTRLDAATVVVGIGAVPNDGWLRGSGLTIDDGVVCDRFSRASEHVHALGDVARWFHPRHGRLVRAEHWTNAVEQAACVAHNIVHPGTPRAHAPVEYVWSDQYDWKIQLAGRTGGELAHVLVPGPDPARSFAVLYADPGGTLAGAVVVNWPRALLTARRALAASAAPATVQADIEALTAKKGRA